MMPFLTWDGSTLKLGSRKAIKNRLWDRSVIIKNEEKREEFRWVQYRAQYFKGEAEIEHITFSDAIMPYLTQLKGQFTRVVVASPAFPAPTASAFTSCSSSSALSVTER
ncbi:RepB family plasmid replication initiator protein [Escherichia coli]